MHEMRPVRPTAVHKSDRLAELVCSNSFRGDKLDNAVGCSRKRCAGLPLVMRWPGAGCRRAQRWPLIARFARGVTRAEHSARHVAGKSGHSRVLDVARVATGPLTSDAFHGTSLVCRRTSAFFDAISPIVLAESTT
jgi:methylenetetrahydrofolate--tRNA-(uracil-5-)-methyltransferase